MKLYFDDTEFGAQLQHTAAKTLYRCADPGEILAVAKRITPDNYQSWYDNWLALAVEVEQIGEHEAAQNANNFSMSSKSPSNFVSLPQGKAVVDIARASA